MAETNSRKSHPGWKYATLDDPKKPNNTRCKFCMRLICGGISRQTKHIIGGDKNVTRCLKATEEAKEELRQYVEKKQREKEDSVNMFGSDFNTVDLDGGDDEDGQVQGGRKKVSSGGSSSIPKFGKNQPRLRGPMDKFVTPNPEFVVQERKRKLKLKQTSISEVYNKEGADLVRQYIARWLYQASIPFNALHLESFHTMIEAIGQFGPGLKPLSYHEARGSFLKKELEYTKNLMKSHEDSWTMYGCSLMSDGWTDRRDRTLINFLVNTPNGTMFLESVDVSSHIKTGGKMFDLLSSFVDKVGEKNVVQVITDNASNLVQDGKLLEAKYPHLYWTPCAAHCLDLMLEDFGKMTRVKRTLQKAMAITGFIYNHPYVLNMMREFTKNKELIRPGVTRFATSFLTLKSIHEQKSQLRSMFVFEKWMSSRWSKEQKGKKVTSYVLMVSFWRDVTYILKASGPLVRVLRLVDGEKTPAMGYIYEAMDRAKEAIKKAFKDDENIIGEIFGIIDRRWDVQLHRPLHAAGYYLNSAFSYDNKTLETDNEVMSGLFQVFDRLVSEASVKQQIPSELPIYRKAKGLFGIEIAQNYRKTKSPVEWWTLFGSSAPNLQQLAIRVLGLTCSASGCERNWSVFEHIHSKKRNRLEQQKLNDLVYIKYNQALYDRFQKRDVINPISLKDIDDSNEWLVGTMGDNSGNVDDGGEDDEFVHDDLSWDVVARASGAEDPERLLRSRPSVPPSSNSRKKGKSVTPSSSARKKGKSVASSSTASLVLQDEEEEVDVEDVEDDEDEEEVDVEDDEDEEDVDDDVDDEDEDEEVEVEDDDDDQVDVEDDDDD